MHETASEPPAASWESRGQKGPFGLSTSWNLKIRFLYHTFGIRIAFSIIASCSFLLSCYNSLPVFLHLLEIFLGFEFLEPSKISNIFSNSRVGPRIRARAAPHRARDHADAPGIRRRPPPAASLTTIAAIGDSKQRIVVGLGLLEGGRRQSQTTLVKTLVVSPSSPSRRAGFREAPASDSPLKDFSWLRPALAPSSHRRSREPAAPPLK